MVTRKIEQKADKYASYRYEIVTSEELREAKWMIAQGDYADMDDYIDQFTKSEIRRMKQEDIEKKKRTDARKKKSIETVKKNKAA
jgi:hypothetical protein